MHSENISISAALFQVLSVKQQLLHICLAYISYSKTISTAHIYTVRGAGRVSGQGGQNSARSAEKQFPFAHPGFQFAHTAIRNGCPPCPPYRAVFELHASQSMPGPLTSREGPHT